MENLLPLEYCKLDRAARLLGCEVDDLIHWGKIGAIDLCLRRPGIGTLAPNIRWDGTEQSSDNLLVSVFENLDISLGSYSILSSVAGYSPIPSFDLLPEDDICRTHVLFSGFWVFGAIHIIELGSVCSDVFVITPYDSKNNGVLGLIAPQEREDFQPISKEDLWIMRPDLEKLKKAIDSGDYLPNIYNNTELAEKNRAQELKSSLDTPPRITAKQSDVIKALVLLNPDLKELVDKPERLTTKLDQLCAGKVKVTLPTGKSMGDWLGKANAEAINE